LIRENIDKKMNRQVRQVRQGKKEEGRKKKEERRRNKDIYKFMN
jgi:hypothetical protein